MPWGPVMFGFLSAPCSGCLGPASHQVYRSHFCGLCNRLREDYGLWSRWLINRDSTFLSLLGAAQQPACPEAVCTTCCNPLGRKRNLYQNGPAAEYAAASTICGLAIKINDDADDEGRLRRWVSRCGGSLLTRPVEKAKAVLENLGFPVESVREGILRQRDVELAIQTHGARHFESAGDPTAESYARIVEYTAQLPNAAGENAVRLHSFGRSLGLLIYWLDAWVDYELDLRRGRFNPLRFVTRSGRPLVQDRLAAVRPLFEEWQKNLAALAGELQLYRYQSLIQWTATTGVRNRLRHLIPALFMSELEEPAPDEPKRKGEQANSCFCCCDGCDCACCVCEGAADGGGDCCCDCGCDGCDCG